jgi:epoxyqueuosine reductase
MKQRLERLVEGLRAEFGGDHRWYVDTGPVLERAHAARSGIGWVGKNTNLLTASFGSFVVLGEIITTLEIEPDRPIDQGCGSCRLCVVACPTGALGPEYTIDSRKCISYLTIEHRGPIPPQYRPLIGSWVFGCDICQEVCPPTMTRFLHSRDERRQWAEELRIYTGHVNVPARSPSEPRLPGPDHPLFGDGVRPSVDLLWLLRLTQPQYVEAFRGSAIKRAKAWMLRRNAAVALGNVGTPNVIEAVACAMAHDEHPIVRGHAAWALGRLSVRHRVNHASDMLAAALEEETDTMVRTEIDLALLTALGSGPSVGTTF